MKFDITIKGLSKETLSNISKRALDEELTLQEYIKKIIENQAEQIKNEEDPEAQVILKKIAEFYMS